jgi:flagellum-specific peptidoglycan hydrolase FlgJ
MKQILKVIFALMLLVTFESCTQQKQPIIPVIPQTDDTIKDDIEEVRAMVIGHKTESKVNKKPKQKLSSREKYIKRFLPTAIAESKKYGIPVSIKLAQGIVESDAGNSSLATKHNIHFCIKDPKNGKGSIKHHDDDPNDHFYTYKSAWYSFRHHSKFLKTHSRYAFLFKIPKTNYKAWAKGLKKAGYATHPHYAEALISVIETHKLYKYDQ